MSVSQLYPLWDRQNSTPKEINATAEAFNDAKANTKRWAENIVKQGHLDKDSNICYTFNIPASDSLYIASIYDCIRMFADQRRTERQIDYSASSAEHVVIKTVAPKILYSDGNMAFAMSIDAYGSMTIDIMPCKLVVTMKVNKYVNTAPFGRKVEPSYGAIWLPVKGAKATDRQRQQQGLEQGVHQCQRRLHQPR